MIDGHCHLDKRFGTPEEAFRFLYQEAVQSGVNQILLLNLPEGAFKNSEVIEYSKEYQGFFRVFPGVNPKKKDFRGKLLQYKNNGAEGIKLHPRIHNYQIECIECVDLLKNAGDLGLPVLIDCFPDGKNIALGNLPGSFGRVSKLAENTKIAMGHAGGHHILDALMIAKQYPNIYLDLSFTLLYYRHLPLLNNIKYVLHNMKYKKIFWGTDYPDRPYQSTINSSLSEIEKMNLPEEGLTALLSRNVVSFLGCDIEKT